MEGRFIFACGFRGFTLDLGLWWNSTAWAHVEKETCTSHISQKVKVKTEISPLRAWSHGPKFLLLYPIVYMFYHLLVALLTGDQVFNQGHLGDIWDPVYSRLQSKEGLQLHWREGVGETLSQHTNGTSKIFS